MNRVTVWVFAVFITAAVGAQPKEKTIPFVTLYEGMRVATYERQDFDEYKLRVSPTALQPVRGTVVRALATGAKGRSSLEVIKNYEDALRRAGFTTVFRCDGLKGCGKSMSTAEYGMTAFYDLKQSRYLVAKLNRPAGAVYVAIHAFEEGGGTSLYVHTVEEKAMDSGMVNVTAEDMSKDITATGHVALYNILFDTTKADIKPESAAGIAEIARMMKSNAALKIHVVGHTDNAGSYDANLDLSRRRADAVVKELTTKHGIAATRLRSGGVGPLAPVASNRSEEGRKRNRRVELVEQ